MGRPNYMPQAEIVPATDADVRLIVSEAFEKYERETAGPRYLVLDGKLTKILSFMDKAVGAFLAIKNLLKYIGLTLTVVYTVVKIVQTVRGH